MMVGEGFLILSWKAAQTVNIMITEAFCTKMMCYILVAVQCHPESTLSVCSADPGVNITDSDGKDAPHLSRAWALLTGEVEQREQGNTAKCVFFPTIWVWSTHVCRWGVGTEVYTEIDTLPNVFAFLPFGFEVYLHAGEGSCAPLCTETCSIHNKHCYFSCYSSDTSWLPGMAIPIETIEIHH